MKQKTFYEKPQTELLALESERNFLIYGNNAQLTESTGEWEE